jgi:hypothetical protein
MKSRWAILITSVLGKKNDLPLNWGDASASGHILVP